MKKPLKCDRFNLCSRKLRSKDCRNNQSVVRLYSLRTVASFFVVLVCLIDLIWSGEKQTSGRLSGVSIILTNHYDVDTSFLLFLFNKLKVVSRHNNRAICADFCWAEHYYQIVSDRPEYGRISVYNIIFMVSMA